MTPSITRASSAQQRHVIGNPGERQLIGRVRCQTHVAPNACLSFPMPVCSFQSLSPSLMITVIVVEELPLDRRDCVTASAWPPGDASWHPCKWDCYIQFYTPYGMSEYSTYYAMFQLLDNSYIINHICRGVAVTTNIHWLPGETWYTAHPRWAPKQNKSFHPSSGCLANQDTLGILCVPDQTKPFIHPLDSRQKLILSLKWISFKISFV